MTFQVLKPVSPNKTERESKKVSNGVEFNDKNLILFFKYIKERHSIYKRRFVEKQPVPWTKDKILQNYKFTNVFRDLDPGTLYVIDKIIPICKSAEEILLNLIIYRLYNKIVTFETTGKQDPYNFNDVEFEKKLRRLKNSGTPVFTNAFTVSSYHWVNPDHDKIKNTTELVRRIAKRINDYVRIIMSAKSSETTYRTLLSIKGLGKFLAYQISVDLGYWNTKVFDEDVFTIAGPGCRKGIDFIFRSKGNLNYEECIFYICKIQEEQFNEIKINQNDLFSDRRIKRLNAMAVENCFCEISKYLKAYYGLGRPRNRFIRSTSLTHFL